LDSPEGAQPEPPAPVSIVICAACHGTGEWRMQTGGRLSDYWVSKCRKCSGTGQVPVEIVVAA